MGGTRYTLESLAADLGVPASKPAGQAIAKLRYTHDAMVDLIIANPGISQNDLAASFGYSASWVCQIIASDAFQSRLAARSSELIDPTIRATVKERFEALVLRSMEILKDKLSAPSEKIPDNLALRTLEIASRGAGYGLQSPTQPAPTAEVTEHLARMGSGLVELLRKTKREAAVFDGEFKEAEHG